MFNLPTDRLELMEASPPAGCVAGAVAGLARSAVLERAGAPGVDPSLFPMLEKFHFSPFSDRTRLICGWSSTRSVTCRDFEKISGIISTPTFRDFACTNADLLNAVSSE